MLTCISLPDHKICNVHNRYQRPRIGTTISIYWYAYISRFPVELCESIKTKKKKKDNISLEHLFSRHECQGESNIQNYPLWVICKLSNCNWFGNYLYRALFCTLYNLSLFYPSLRILTLDSFKLMQAKT